LAYWLRATLLRTPISECFLWRTEKQAARSAPKPTLSVRIADDGHRREGGIDSRVASQSLSSIHISCLALWFVSTLVRTGGSSFLSRRHSINSRVAERFGQSPQTCRFLRRSPAHSAVNLWLRRSGETGFLESGLSDPPLPTQLKERLQATDTLLTQLFPAICSILSQCFWVALLVQTVARPV